jgi:hypothetical protein
MSEVHFDSDSQSSNQTDDTRSNESAGFLIDFFLDNNIAKDRGQAVFYLGIIGIILLAVIVVNVMWGFDIGSSSNGAPESLPPTPTQDTS